MVFSREQLNYFRLCYVVVDILAEGLRTVFKREWDNHHKSTMGEWKDDPKNGMDFYNGESPRNQRRNAHILATMRKGDRSEWDCTMLFYAILFSDCIGNGLNAATRKNVDDLRKFRNEFFRVQQGNLSDLDFDNAISKVHGAFKELRLSDLKIERIKYETSFPTEELQKVANEVDDLHQKLQEKEIPLFCVLPPKPSHDIGGRNREEAEVAQQLRELKEANENSLSYLYISGNPGSGKSQLAGLVAKRFFDEVKEMPGASPFVMTLNAASLDTLLESYVLFARQLKCPEYLVLQTLGSRDLKIGEKIGSLKMLIAANIGLYTSWLLVVDNVTSVSSVQVYLPEAGNEAWAKGQLLITTQDTTSIPLQSSFINHISVSKAYMPSYVEARGERAIAAYLKAKETGTTLDRRVKVMLIGQDRVGKTSVGRSLKGEMFRDNETSTDGVQMHEPFQNPGQQPWKNFTMEETTTYHHKYAEYISRELHGGPTVEQALQQELETEPPGSMSSNSALDENQMASISGLSRDLRQKASISGLPDDQTGRSRRLAADKSKADSNIPEQIAHLVSEKVKEKEFDTPDGIWPVIWDFAGQAVYRAIHPIFMSPEAVYVLVYDLRKNLFSTAPCKVKEDGREEVEIAAPDSGDTNLDHILRWMDLVHSLRQSESEYKLPPVVLVGTHADEVDYPEKKMDDLKNFLMYNAKDFFKRIAKPLPINNTLAGRLSIQGEEDPQIVRLRQEILTVAETLPHTKEKFPLKWLEVENKVCDYVNKKNEKYMSKQKFKMKIFATVYQPELEDVLEHILNFLHDRGTIVYHDRPENPDGLIVLDPQWLISDVLCKIITAKQEKEDEPHIELLRQDLGNKGILHEELLHHACRNLELVHIKESLIYIMKKFNLLFERKGKNEKTAYLVPCMLTSKPTEDMMSNVFQGCNPVFITFSTNYVPFGLFTRLLVIFGEWAASRTSCEEPQLFAEAARFVIGEITCLIISCCKTVIKIHIYTMDNSNPVETEPGIASEVYRILQDALQRLRDECHWLGTVSWKLCGQCKLCPGKVDPKSRKCFRHQEPKCSHDDCAHYVPIRRSHFCCQDGKGPDLRIPHTWIQALSSDVAFQKQSCNKGKRTAGSGLEELSHDPLPIKRLRIANYSVKEGTPSNDELEDLSRRVTDVWVSLGRRLNFNEAEISAFDEENKKCSEKAYKMLLCWRQREGEDATYQILYYALCHKLVERKELAEKLCCDENLLS